MSYFDYERFGARPGNIPPFESVFDIKSKKTTLGILLSEFVEDVEFVEITDETPNESPKGKALRYDKEARAEETMKEVERVENRANKKKDPLMGMAIVTYFLVGSTWSDDNPESNFRNKYERDDAFNKELDKIWKEVPSGKGNSDPLANILFKATAAMGFHWATENPPKYY